VKQGFLILFLLLFNSLLFYTYWQRQSYHANLSTLIANGPSLEDYVLGSERATNSFIQSYSSDSSYHAFAGHAKHLATGLLQWEQSNADQYKESGLFEIRDVPQGFQDSIWTALANYRNAIDDVLTLSLTRRKLKRNQYHQLNSVYARMVSLPLSQQQKGIDSLSGALNYSFYPPDARGLGELVRSLDYQSDPVEEFYMNTLLNKFDTMVASRGRIILYDRDYVLGDMSVLQERNVVHRLIMLKHSIDQQLLTLANP
jgi:hypothetical protein